MTQSNRFNNLLRSDQSGAALILTLLIITVLVVLVLETLRAMQVEGAAARHFQDSIQAEALAKSGVNVAIALLVQDLEEDLKDGAPKQDIVDYPGEPWALVTDPDSIPTELSKLGTLEGKVTDESGKFPINHLVSGEEDALQQNHREVLERLLINAPFLMEQEDAKGLINAIKDWLDSDDEPTGELGAETDYYEILEQPYPCKNGPLTSLDELLLIRGMGPELYFGNEGSPGLKDLLTIYGEGSININTAELLVLQALPNVAQDTALDWAESVIAYREEPMHWDFLKESDWYRNRVAGFADINLPAKLITLRSSHFSVQMTGKVGVGRKSVFAYLERQTSEDDKEPGVTVGVRFWQVY
ncbi:MAG: type II secretion system minor pseudopilin GspK [Deltaproteobacteria bacterium]|nr:MAG: type II secretion system minor pseudopilin GspK [Deltaproteobacteria bacterium]